MMRNIIFLLVSVLFFNTYKSQDIQKDTIYGNVKKVDDRIVFLTKEKRKLLKSEGYCSGGISIKSKDPVGGIYKHWFEFESICNIHYKRLFDKKRRLTQDISYDKNDNFSSSSKYIYYDNGKIESKIDSSDSSKRIKNYYYEISEKRVDENIFYQSLNYNSFFHSYNSYENDKLMRSKYFDEYGAADEYIYKYNAEGKLLYRIYKNPNTWKKCGERSWCYGVQDSIGTIYKDIINKYDENGRLIHSQNFSLYDDKNYQKPILKEQTQYIYNKGNLITKIINNNIAAEPVYYNYNYDGRDNLTEYYCCSKNIADGELIRKYYYKNNRISKLEYFPERKKTVITYQYKIDKNNNWIEIIKKINGIDMYKWIRKIQYY